MPPASTSKDVSLLIGQLVEASQAATDGLRLLNRDLHDHNRFVAALAKTVEVLQTTVNELDRLVRTGNGEAVLTQLAVLRRDLVNLRESVEGLQIQLTDLRNTLTDLSHSSLGSTARHHLLLELGKVVAWLVTTAIAAVAAVRGVA